MADPDLRHRGAGVVRGEAEPAVQSERRAARQRADDQPSLYVALGVSILVFFVCFCGLSWIMTGDFMWNMRPSSGFSAVSAILGMQQSQPAAFVRTGRRCAYTPCDTLLTMQHIPTDSREFTMDELAKHDGTDANGPILLAIKYVC